MARDLSIEIEPWSDALWAEIKALAAAHFEEVDGGVEPKRPLRVSNRLMTMLSESGVMIMVLARKAGRLIGYYTWNMMEDVESEGLLIAQQGAWYVAPGHRGAALAMFERSLAELKARGVQCIYPHHRTQGRGAGLGRFFKRHGAKEIQHTYSLWIGA